MRSCALAEMARAEVRTSVHMTPTIEMMDEASILRRRDRARTAVVDHREHKSDILGERRRHMAFSAWGASYLQGACI